ncbi:MAG TPA: PIN domain-containing protein [Thermoanaerobaculia bacterium]|nr:PIN domain-containing protein [Thermoanaerobaculia bacterium]
MVLVDSSVWILVEHERLDLRDVLPPDIPPAVCPIVVQEVLRGARNFQRYAYLRRMLMRAEMLDDPTPLSRFEEAAGLYLRCRDSGVTPSSVDSLIAACAMANGIPLLHDDDDFDHIARIVPLELIRP